MPVHVIRRRRWNVLGVLLAVLLGATISGLLASQTDASPILRTVTIGHGGGLTLTLDEQTHRAFIFNRNEGTLSVLDTRTGALLRTLPSTSTSGVWLAVAQRTGRLFISNMSAGTTSMLDGATGTVLRSAPDSTPLGLAVDDRRGHVLVGHMGDSTLSLFDVRKGALLRHLPACSEVFAVAVSVHTGHIFAKCDDNTTAMLDGRSGRVLHTVVNTTGPYGCLGVDERTDRVFAFGGPQNGTGQVDVLDARTGRLLPRHALLIPGGGSCVTADAHSGVVYEAQLSAGPFMGQVNSTVVVALDGWTGALRRRIHVPANPLCVALDQSTGRLLVGSAGLASTSTLPMGDGTLTVVRASDGRVLRSVRIGITPTDLIVDASAHRVLVLNSASDMVTPSLAVTWRPREEWAPQVLRRIKDWLPWLPYTAPRHLPAAPSPRST